MSILPAAHLKPPPKDSRSNRWRPEWKNVGDWPDYDFLTVCRAPVPTAT